MSVPKNDPKSSEFDPRGEPKLLFKVPACCNEEGVSARLQKRGYRVAFMIGNVILMFVGLIVFILGLITMFSWQGNVLQGYRQRGLDKSKPMGADWRPSVDLINAWSFNHITQGLLLMILGFVGVHLERVSSYTLAFIYAGGTVTMLFGTLLNLIGGIIAIIHFLDLETFWDIPLMINSYEANRLIVKGTPHSIDLLQMGLGCCGGKNFEDWLEKSSQSRHWQQQYLKRMQYEERGGHGPEPARNFITYYYDRGTHTLMKGFLPLSCCKDFHENDGYFFPDDWRCADVRNKKSGTNVSADDVPFHVDGCIDAASSYATSFLLPIFIVIIILVVPLLSPQQMSGGQTSFFMPRTSSPPPPYPLNNDIRLNQQRSAQNAALNLQRSGVWRWHATDHGGLALCLLYRQACAPVGYRIKSKEKRKQRTGQNGAAGGFGLGVGVLSCWFHEQAPSRVLFPPSSMSPPWVHLEYISENQ
ncbi:unnamed protein product [Cyprideis torosa]|uniref:Uncharacterized protein n=1 Tax=Cyprideis torosa TaxID=163714 RepID=A0A7R8W4L6_9CRUS|nr:unnamed protein product [Cyprideis torosa]CAG0879960.1 unnamed protein product [Cyprideis torosa]